MRILDKKGKDYYDGVLLSMYREVDLLLVRETEEVYVPTAEKEYTDWRSEWNWGKLNPDWPFGEFAGGYRYNSTKRDRDFYLGFLGFCGKVYPFLQERSYKEKTVYHFSVPDSTSVGHTCLNRIFEFYKKPNKDFENFWQKMMEDKGCPTFLANPFTKEIIWGVHLSTYDFHRVMNQYEAAQTVYQWLSNRSNPDKPLPKFDDVTMAEIHGFDPKLSFRKKSNK